MLIKFIKAHFPLLVKSSAISLDLAKQKSPKAITRSWCFAFSLVLASWFFSLRASRARSARTCFRPRGNLGRSAASHSASRVARSNCVSVTRCTTRAECALRVGPSSIDGNPQRLHVVDNQPSHLASRSAIPSPRNVHRSAYSHYAR